MNRPILAIVANPENINKLLLHLDYSKYNVLLGSDTSITGYTRLALISIEGQDIKHLDSPWLAWDQTDDPVMISKAYQAGARAVFPKEIPLKTIAETINRTISELTPHSIPPESQKHHSYHRGELILLKTNEVLFVQDGIVATTMVHQDGKDVLLGMSGKGELIIGHPDDTCHIQIIAYTDSVVEIESWENAVEQPGFSEKMKQRLQRMEGWSAMQARPSLPQRVLGILGLLAGQFGQAHDQGTIIDVRITHTQLASALGSTRTSITRILSELRNNGKIMILSINGEDRYCLCDQSLVEKHDC